MVYVKWFLLIFFWTLFGAFLHYSLPKYDVVRIVNTHEERIDLDDWTRIFWSDPTAQSKRLMNRDVQFIQGIRGNGRTIVYRNEDTGWGWPPYFKFDTANLYTEASDLVSTKADPQWVAIKYFGWRSIFFSIFPNAISITPVDGPEEKPFNWFTTLFLITLGTASGYGYYRWRRFRRERLSPVFEEVGDNLNAAGDAFSRKRNRFQAWLDTWKTKKR
ncbi:MULTISPECIES: DUF1523 family protein [unclassified Halomonas]|uniref:DUF1523 family protein n=1 Tax=unclassified Halomonas TaxID=2609666 RepID=UPI0006DA3301|nr:MULTISPECIES: DUF1523 family protein [unclassified Halomonas]KPQ23912.1 MAG: protein of unknown function DUF1523 [Halomonas sp. HL-93]SBR46643.1 Protein of unknown function (DUF1523) [Halomonas sp. HL-93]SNY98846.1 Protein of unknown function [Halomonas sp. hl-4]